MDRAVIKYHKYHALGNDYLVIDPAEGRPELAPAEIRAVCDRHYGVGSDGILIGPFDAPGADFSLRLFNPDGGEFEKSGNGLRIFSRYLWDTGRVGAEPFTILTPGGRVTSRVAADGGQVTVEMGQVSFDSRQIPVLGPAREVVDEVMILDGQEMRFSCATLGNPHCVVVRDQISAQDAQRWGPAIECAPLFPNRTNVQFMRVLDRSTIQIEIWERGAGYTLASGSSSSAAAAVARRLGLCDDEISVHMPGGVIAITLADDWSVTMTGAVARICDGMVHEEMFTGYPR